MKGGAIVFVWLREEETPANVLSSFDDIPDDEKGDIFVQYCFLNCENTFFSELWWDALSSKNRIQVQAFANTLFYEGGKFVVNENKLVDWTFT